MQNQTKFYIVFIILFNVIIMGKINIIPNPQLVKEEKGKYILTSKTKFYSDVFQNKLDFFLSEFQNEVKEKYNLGWKLLTGKNSDNKSIVFSNYDSKDITSELKNQINTFGLKGKEESYILLVNSNGIKIFSNNEKGAFYGLMSLLQLCDKKVKEGIELPYVLVVDFPNIALRGISDDISRGQVSILENFKRIIKFSARYKMNTFYPYMEDVIEIKAYPEIGLNRGRLTQEEVKELVAYGQKYFVELIPIFQTLGHWENLLIQPKYFYLADFPGAASFDLTNEKIYEFIDNCVKEISALFPSQYFHAGCDESWDVGFGNSKLIKDRYGLGTIHANHYKKVNEILKKYGKKMMMYGDIIHNHPDIFDQLPKDIVVVDWRYGAQDYEPFVKKYFDYKLPFIVSPSVTNFNRIFPWIENSIYNIKVFTEVSNKYGTVGFINSNWGDNGGENFRENNWFGYAFGAECSWNSENVDADNFKQKFFNDFYLTDSDEMSLIYRLLSDYGMMIHQYDFWRQPFLPLRESQEGMQLPPPLRGESIKSLAKTILKQVDKIEPKVNRNKYHVEYLRFAAEQAYWFGNKLSTSLYIKRLIDKNKGVLTAEQKSQISSMVDEIINDLEKMKVKYIKLWEATNKPDNLNTIIKEKYYRQLASWIEFKENLNKDVVEYDSRIKSFWICHPESNPGEKDKPQVENATFRRYIEVNKEGQNVKLQLLGDSFAELYVNNQLVGDVRGRITLSLLVESMRAKIFDISKYLTIGQNEIKVVCKNFGNNPNARVNVQIYLDENNKIYSDGTWMVSKDGQNFVNAKEIKENNNLNEPNFRTSRTSWRER